MTLRATRAASEILGRGDTLRLRITRVFCEILGCGDNDRVQASRVVCEILGEWVALACRISRLGSEILGHGSNERVQATQVGCEVLGEWIIPAVRVSSTDAEILGHGDKDRLETTHVQCEILGELIVSTLRVSALDSEILGHGDNDRIQTTHIGCEILGELIVSTLRVTALGSEILGCGDVDRIQTTQVGCEILGEWVVPAIRVASVALELLANSPVGRFALGMDYYGTLIEAESYFGSRLHENAWSDADPGDRPKALWAATQIIDTLNFKGHKHPVHVLLQQNSLATSEEIRAAEVSQVLEFPRDGDTEVPEAIRQACYEIAHSLLDGKDPELELEALGIASQGYSSVKTTYARDQVPIEHIVNGVPNAMAWRLLRPFLRDADEIKLSRIS
jgi:hypothetical protein